MSNFESGGRKVGQPEKGSCRLLHVTNQPWLLEWRPDMPAPGCCQAQAFAVHLKSIGESWRCNLKATCTFFFVVSQPRHHQTPNSAPLPFFLSHTRPSSNSLHQTPIPTFPSQPSPNMASYDDSESDDDNFNPAPADVSDDENMDDAPTSGSGARKAASPTSSPAAGHDDDDEDDHRPAKPAGKRPFKSVADDDEDEDAEEDEEEVEQRNDDEEEEDEEDEDDDVQHVSCQSSPSLPLLLDALEMLHTIWSGGRPAGLPLDMLRDLLTSYHRAAAASVARTNALPSSISKPRSMTRTRAKTTKRTARRLKTSSTMPTLTILPTVAV